ncbi:MAG: ABC transporter permease, partial [Prevotellaceae bacterium]|nr:ABC transporter permease [Prevotellaceae bacterium]
KSVEVGKADIILEIQPDFEKELIRTGFARVMISANAVNGVKGGIGSSYLAGIVRDYSSDLLTDQGIVNRTGQTPTIAVVSHNLFNPHLDYKIFMIPALMVMLLTLLSGFLPALNIVSEKETGTIEQMNVTPVSKIMFIFAKLVPYWTMGFVVLSLGLGLSVLIYGLYPLGSLATIYLYASVYVLVVSGLGLVISNYSDSMQQAMFVIFFFVVILILISGLFTPVSSMPEWAQWITVVNPLKYFMEVMRSVYLKGSGMSELMPQLFALCGFALFFNAWAVLSYKKSA